MKLTQRRHGRVHPFIHFTRPFAMLLSSIFNSDITSHMMIHFHGLAAHSLVSLSAEAAIEAIIGRERNAAAHGRQGGNEFAYCPFLLWPFRLRSTISVRHTCSFRHLHRSC
ncbi:hypothetical protein I7I50_00555 [Histoplasma capsulatum G186AR]|uniref:Uncharacterized protein n=1 Tax=Ajellomyces capsulatus TaxID=5037 RepID=A0A8H7YJK5_AJECA|nr:hypothetical protein I7I52_07823 [Histoplasma capsulatum]QSS72642.1 hypothetical protein I7I50_00555 [Histoplasma capsulatum G186AR]